MSAKKATDGRVTVATNRRARYDYQLGDKFEAGIALVGTEVKSLREARVTLGEGFVEIVGNEAWLVGVHIPEYTFGNMNNHNPTRRRKLLLKRNEIDKIRGRTREQGFTAVPLELYFKNGWCKLEFALAKGQKHYDKRQNEKEKIARRELRQREY